jgi:hypothetical protein
VKLSPNPDLTSTRGLLVATLLITALVWGTLIAGHVDITTTLGDTDDAMRLVLVRELLHGRGWYDQLVTRLDPPHGVWMHWSRLLDGGIAALDRMLELVLPSDQAEWATRYFWPLLWIPGAVAGALVIARETGPKSAVFVAAPILLTVLPLYRQFLPGRIDHHDVQITLAVLAVAGGVRREPTATWSAAAGVACGLGLAVGLEALAFHALVGVSFGARIAFDRTRGLPAAAYGAALGASSLGLYLLQTPPQRWGLSFCDAIGLNLVAALDIAGAGIALAAILSGRLPGWARGGIVVGCGLVAATAYLALDPACRAGPFAGLDPRVRPFWFDLIQEIQPLPEVLGRQRLGGFEALAAMTLGLASSAFLIARTWRRPDVGTLLLAACMVVAAVAGFKAWRMCDYVYWFSAPAIAAALSYATARLLADRMVPTFGAALALSPFFVGAAAAGVSDIASPPKHFAEAPQSCSDVAAFRALARLPPGVVLSEIDLGPHILANTPHSAIAAPYHRMSAAILAAHEAFAAGPAAAEAHVRTLRADYIADCPGLFIGVGPGTLAWELRQGRPPAWLVPLSPRAATLQLYRVRRRIPAASLDRSVP